MTSEHEGLRPRASRRVRLAYLVSHPIQYQTPLMRRIAQEPDIDLTVFFGSDFSVKEYRDQGFGVGEGPFDVLWLHGYATINAMRGMMAAKALGIPVLMRADSWLRDRERTGLRLALKNIFFAGLQRMVDVVLPVGALNA